MKFFHFTLILASLTGTLSLIQANEGVGSSSTHEIVFGAPSFLEPDAFLGLKPGIHEVSSGDSIQLVAPYRLFKDIEGNTIEIQHNQSDSPSTSPSEQRMRATFQRYVSNTDGVISTARSTTITVEKDMVIQAEYLIEFDQLRTTALTSNTTLSTSGDLNSFADPIPSAANPWIPANEVVEPSIMGAVPVPQTASNDVVQGERLAVTEYKRDLYPVTYGIHLEEDSFLSVDSHYNFISLSTAAGKTGFNYEMILYLDPDEFKSYENTSGEIFSLLWQGQGFWTLQWNESQDRFVIVFYEYISDTASLLQGWELPEDTEGWVTLTIRHSKHGSTEEYYVHPYITTPGESEAKALGDGPLLGDLPDNYGSEGQIYYGSPAGIYRTSPAMVNQLRFWKDDLTASEIATYANRSLTGQEEWLVNAWNFQTFDGRVIFGIAADGGTLSLPISGPFSFGLQVASDPVADDDFIIRPDPAFNSRISFPPYQQTGPTNLSVNLERQFQITLASSQAEGIPPQLSFLMTGDDLPVNISDGSELENTDPDKLEIRLTDNNRTGTGRYWIGENERFIIGTFSTSEDGNELKGWNDAQGLAVPSTNNTLGTPLKVAKNITIKGPDGNTQTGDFYYFSRRFAENPVSVTWNFGNPVFRFDGNQNPSLAVGDSFDPNTVHVSDGSGSKSLLDAVKAAYGLSSGVDLQITNPESPTLELIGSTSPNVTAQGMVEWSLADGALFTFEPGTILVEWNTNQTTPTGHPVNITVELTIDWPDVGSANFISKVLGTGGVLVDPDSSDDFRFDSIRFWSGSQTDQPFLTQGSSGMELNIEHPGRTVIRYLTSNQSGEPPSTSVSNNSWSVKVVESMTWRDSLALLSQGPVPSDIGSPVPSITFEGQPIDRAGLGSGYVLMNASVGARAPFATNLHDNASTLAPIAGLPHGPVIPVNTPIPTGGQGVLGASGLGDTWQFIDVQRGTRSAGSFSIDKGTLTLSGVSGDIIDKSDDFQYFCLSNGAPGAFAIQARVTSLSEGGTYAKAGLMARNNRDPDAVGLFSEEPMYSIFVEKDVVVVLMRSKQDEDRVVVKEIHIDGGIDFPIWLRLSGSPAPGTSSEQTFTMNSYYSMDGVHWEQAGDPSTLELEESPYYGLAYTSDNDSETGQATFDSITLSSGRNILWTGEGIGLANPILRELYRPEIDGNEIHLNALGALNTNESDEFTYLYRGLPGNTQNIVARVDDFESAASDSALGGIMLRTSSDKDAAYIAAFISKEGKKELWSRSSPGVAAVKNDISTISLPAWFRLQRTGDSILAEYSADGISWSPITGDESSSTIEFGSGVLGDYLLAGLAADNPQPTMPREVIYSQVQAPIGTNVQQDTGSNDQRLVVVYYEEVDGSYWPYQAVEYTPRWPLQPDGIITIASGLGSQTPFADGSAQNNAVLSPNQYANLVVYNQPDRSLPGYNPNEEHALVTASNPLPQRNPAFADVDFPTPVSSDFAVFALRNDLNITPQSSYFIDNDARPTSQPYVLVSYTNVVTGDVNMLTYWVERDELPSKDGSERKTITFEFDENVAATLAEPPYPLGILDEANANPDTFLSELEEGDPRAYFLDYTGVYWNVAGDLSYHGFYFYPMTANFAFPDLGGSEPQSFSTGSYIPWLPNDPASPLPDPDAAPFRLRYNFDNDLPWLPVPVLQKTDWPDNVPQLQVGDTLTRPKNDLPGVLNWLTGTVVYDGLNPLGFTFSNAEDAQDHSSVRIYDALGPVVVTLSTSDRLPQAVLETDVFRKFNQDLQTELVFFKLFAPSVSKRLGYDPTSGNVVLLGLIDGQPVENRNQTSVPADATVLEPNVMNGQELFEILTALAGPPNDSPWSSISSSERDAFASKIKELYWKSRLNGADPATFSGATNWAVGLQPVSGSSSQWQPANEIGPGLALTTNIAALLPLLEDNNSDYTGNYVTLAENNDPSAEGNPVSLEVIQIVPELADGVIAVQLPENPLEDALSLRINLDFGANDSYVVPNFQLQDNVERVLSFDWIYQAPNPDDPDFPQPPAGSTLQNIMPWQAFDANTAAIHLQSNPAFLLTNWFFYSRYHPVNNRDVMSEWAGAANSVPVPGEFIPQLATGWVDRVIENINPLETRYSDFTNTDAPEAWTSLIQQAGAPFSGDVALQDDKSFIEGVGLIEFYQTVSNRALMLAESAISAGVTDNQRKNLSQVLLRAANRISFLYRMLGDEAYSDAMDPLIGAIRFGVDPNFPQASSTPAYEQLDAITLQPSVFAFQNMKDNLLEEELALLMGRSLPGTGPTPSTGAPPVHNRLYWNFTGGQGQMAYLLNYAIDDITRDGFINAADAEILYPQGHGDAWGHYLSALQPYYNILQLTEFPWVAGTQPFALEDSVIEVDFWNERSLAEAASARQKAGLAIFERVYQQSYRKNSPAQWIGYTDTNTERAWGVDGWASRSGLAGVFDWATTNAVLPAAPSPESGNLVIASGDETTSSVAIASSSGSPRPIADIANDLTAALNQLNDNSGPGGQMVRVSASNPGIPGMSFHVEWSGFGDKPLLTADASGLAPASLSESKRITTTQNTAVSLSGSGSGLSGDSDQFQFWSGATPLEGEGSIQTFVTYLDPANNNSEAGVMLRAGNDPDAATVALTVSSGSGLSLLYRAQDGATLQQGPVQADIIAPVWLRLVRAEPDSDGASQVQALYSKDGTLWTSAGSTPNITLGSSALYGTINFSSNDANATNSIFDQILATTSNGSSSEDWTFTAIGNPTTTGGATLGTRQAQRISLRQDGRHISLVDRAAVPELMEIASAHHYLQSLMDRVNAGLNPIGVAPNVVPFDVDPRGIIPASGFGMDETHFEQIYARALSAWRRAFRVMKYANIQKANLRAVQFDTERLRLGTTSEDFRFRNELIELLGTPYQGLIGNGKPYPAGYDGPDYYFYNFINQIDGMASVSQPSAELVTFFRKFQVTVDRPEGGDVDGTAGDAVQELFGRYFKNDTGERRALDIPGELSNSPEIKIENMPLTASDYGFVAPSNWGDRAAPGLVQRALQRVVRAQLELDGAVIDYGNLVDSIMTAISLINAKSQMNIHLRDLEKEKGAAINALEALAKTLKKTAEATRFVGESGKGLAGVIKEAFPIVSGVSDDLTSAGRSASLAVGQAAFITAEGAALIQEASAISAVISKNILEVQKELEAIDIEYAFEVKDQLASLEDLLNQEARLRNRVADQVLLLREMGNEYSAAVQRAQRLWEKRIGWNRKISSATQKQKTLDMAFRIERNIALRQYREALELARRYTYLAAKAYDYDTALPSSDPASVSHVMHQIISTRHLGVISGDDISTGVPVAGMGGLGGALDWMKTNYEQFKSQSGLLSPGLNRLSLSLREQLARIADSDDKHWRTWLSGSHSTSGNGNVSFYYDLATNPIYRTYCRPYVDSPQEAVPGFVITFGSTVTSGDNFFGHPLSGGLSAYDPTRYATRIFSAGVEFKGYDTAQLSSTPRVYLVPVGTDITRMPGANQGRLRKFDVVEQRLPVAAMPAESELSSMEWSPRLDAMNGSFSEIRRHSAFDALIAPPDDTFDTQALHTDTRLIGRSVWNTEWHLIIPLNSMHHIGSFSATDGSSPDDVADLFRQISDIVLHLQTYSISGN